MTEDLETNTTASVENADCTVEAPKKRQRKAPTKTNREELENVVRNCLTQRGYNKTSVALIAAEAGVSVGTVYNFFPSKERMVLDTLGLQEYDTLYDALIAFLKLRNNA